ncbi:hypothetical protein FKN01_07820 [Streptomyces sp. 130]|uniref:hypothetical protein n=1 Tax=Streptomyces sp. 130 TaxID=2591006 RepID=UPI00117D34B4|nr:hypothetical protein [Streptomyces sp. 130]TRV80104.1 hypothetical protein FKN01_07820 [Streptomyces sp. 130]
MKLYFNVVRRWWTVLVATALLGLVSWSLGGTEIPVPGFIGGMVSMRVEYFAPLLVIVAVLYCLERRLEAPESTAAVRLRRWDLAAVSLTAFLGHVLGLFVGMDIPRNLMLLLALALLVRQFSNEAAAGGACLLFLLATATLGRYHRPSGQPTGQWWALPLYPPGSLTAWAVTLAIFGCGLLSSGRSRRLR